MFELHGYHTPPMFEPKTGNSTGWWWMLTHLAKAGYQFWHMEEERLQWRHTPMAMMYFLPMEGCRSGI